MTHDCKGRGASTLDLTVAEIVSNLLARMSLYCNWSENRHSRVSASAYALRHILVYLGPPTEINFTSVQMFLFAKDQLVAANMLHDATTILQRYASARIFQVNDVGP